MVSPKPQDMKRKAVESNIRSNKRAKPISSTISDKSILLKDSVKAARRYEKKIRSSPSPPDDEFGYIHSPSANPTIPRLTIGQDRDAEDHIEPIQRVEIVETSKSKAVNGKGKTSKQVRQGQRIAA
jgi:hypothetical protein